MFAALRHELKVFHGAHWSTWSATCIEPRRGPRHAAVGRRRCRISGHDTHFGRAVNQDAAERLHADLAAMPA